MTFDIVSDVIKSNPTLPGFEGDSAIVTEIGIMFGAVPPTAEEVEDIMAKAVRVRNAANWVIGDAINYLSSIPGGEQYDKWAKKLGMEVTTLYNIATVAKKVSLETRRSQLKFEHHKAVAALPPPEQAMWLDSAIENGLTRDKLRKSILLGRVANDSDMVKLEGGKETINGHLIRIKVLWNKLKEELWHLDASPQELYLLHRAFLSSTTIHHEIIDAIMESNDEFTKYEVAGDMATINTGPF